MGWDGDAMGMEGEDLSARRVHLGVILLRTTYPEFSARGRGGEGGTKYNLTSDSHAHRSSYFSCVPRTSLYLTYPPSS